MVVAIRMTEATIGLIPFIKEYFFFHIIKLAAMFNSTRNNLLNMKGMSFLTFVIITSLLFILISVFAIITYRYYENGKKNLKEQAARQVAFEIISEISALYQKASSMDTVPANGSIILLEDVLTLPEKIAGETYYIEAVSSPGLMNYLSVNATLKEWHARNVLLMVFEKEKYYFELPNMPIVFQGRASPEEVKIKYVRYKVGDEIKDAVVLGEQKNLIDVEIIQ